MDLELEGFGRPARDHPQESIVVLLDTHFLLWTALRSRRLAPYPWLADHQPWAVSPVSLLEIQFLAEAGRVDVRPGFFDALRRDSRYVIDEPAFESLMQAAMPLDWTRDPFDRLLCAHSSVRRMPLCTLDRGMRKHHTLLPRQLR